MTDRYPTAAEWLRANDVDLAPMTGTDMRALNALAETWELYAYTRSPLAIEAVRSILCVMQSTTRDLTKKLIARAMDWDDVEPLWDLVMDDAPWDDLADELRTRHASAIDRAVEKAIATAKKRGVL
jgi:hypothetical protein